MAEMGTHVVWSGTIAILISRIPAGTEEKMGLAALVSFLGHFAIDAFPHGDIEVRKQLASGVALSFIVLLFSFLEGGGELFFISCIGLFFGTVFDGIVILAKKKFYKTRWGSGVIKTNKWVHWFLRNKSFLVYRQNKPHEEYAGKWDYSLKYGWYDTFLLSSGIIAFSLTFN